MERHLEAWKRRETRCPSNKRLSKLFGGAGAGAGVGASRSPSHQQMHARTTVRHGSSAAAPQRSPSAPVGVVGVPQTGVGGVLATLQETSPLLLHLLGPGPRGAAQRAHQGGSGFQVVSWRRARRELEVLRTWQRLYCWDARSSVIHRATPSINQPSAAIFCQSEMLQDPTPQFVPIEGNHYHGDDGDDAPARQPISLTTTLYFVLRTPQTSCLQS